MLREARDNTLAATQKYQSRQLKLTGVVIATGKKKIEHDLSRPNDGRWVEAPGTGANTEYPFVEIRDAEHPSQDYVTCYLERADALAQLAPGTHANVNGFLLEYAMAGGHVQAVMNRCSVEAVH
jgi:hypothetical protein